MNKNDLSMKNKDYAIIALFENTADILHAAEKVRSKGYTKFEVYTPFPVHGMDDSMGLKPSILGWIVLIGGSFGLCGGFGLQTWAQVVAYPYIISGKPFFSFQAFVPVTFELMVLFSAFATVFGMFALNGLPQFNHPIFNSKLFKHVTSHQFALAIECSDSIFNKDEVETFLGSLNPLAIEIIEESYE